jgi:hypothetical protein
MGAILSSYYGRGFTQEDALLSLVCYANYYDVAIDQCGWYKFAPGLDAEAAIHTVDDGWYNVIFGEFTDRRHRYYVAKVGRRYNTAANYAAVGYVYYSFADNQWIRHVPRRSIDIDVLDFDV